MVVNKACIKQAAVLFFLQYLLFIVFGLSGKLKVGREINVEVEKSDLLLELMFKQMNIQLMSSGFKNVPLCLSDYP